jgi:hypothetical protein
VKGREEEGGEDGSELSREVVLKRKNRLFPEQGPFESDFEGSIEVCLRKWVCILYNV